MKQLWAPWRIEYVLGEKPGYCIFCEYPKESRDRERLILYRGRLCYVIMNKYPYNNGHLMIVPYEHRDHLNGYSTETLHEMMELADASVARLEKAMRPEGFNTGINVGKPAGAGIDEHLHMHIVPRWTGDAGFMAVLDEVRVMPEHLMATYDKLAPLFKE